MRLKNSIFDAPITCGGEEPAARHSILAGKYLYKISYLYIYSLYYEYIFFGG